MTHARKRRLAAAFAMASALSMSACEFVFDTSSLGDGSDIDEGGSEAGAAAFEGGADRRMDADADVFDYFATCNPLTNEAPLIQFERSVAPPPVMHGGTLTDGRYFATAAVYYANFVGDGGPFRATLEVSHGGTFLRLTTTAFGVNMSIEDPQNGALTIDQDNLTMDRSCDGVAPKTWAFEATATRLDLEDVKLSFVQTFTKQ